MENKELIKETLEEELDKLDETKIQVEIALKLFRDKLTKQLEEIKYEFE